MTIRDAEIQTPEDRATALTALAAGDQKKAGKCIGSDEMAALVAGKLGDKERRHCHQHLAWCQTCYDEWRQLAMAEKAVPGRIIKGPWFSKYSLSLSAAGSLLAAAACILLYLNLSPGPIMMSEAPAPAPMVMEEMSAEPSTGDEVQLQLPAEKSSAAPSVPKLSRSAAPQVTMAPEAKKKEYVDNLGKEMAAPRPAPSRDAAIPSKQRAMVGEQDASGQEESVAADFARLMDENDFMVDISNVIPVVLKKMEELGPGQALVLQTFKRDRSLTLVRLDVERILIREEGFVQVEHEVDAAKLKKALKPLLKREFPRSNKVRIRVDQLAGQE